MNFSFITEFVALSTDFFMPFGFAFLILTIPNK